VAGGAPSPRVSLPRPSPVLSLWERVVARRQCDL
jgi:hypothetical protein